MELLAVQDDTYTPISLAVVVDGKICDVDAVTSGSITIAGTTITLTPDVTQNRMLGYIPEVLTEVPGVFVGTGSLVTNTGTYAFPDGGLALRVLQSYREPAEFLMSEALDFLMTETLDYLILEF